MNDKYFIDDHGSVDEFEPGKNKRKHVRFPVRLAVRYGRELLSDYSSFILNVSKGGVFIETDQPLDVGTEITMHFYIPPEVKLLGEFMGKIVWVNTDDSTQARGMGIRFHDYTHESIEQLIELLEEKRHLVNRRD